MIPNVWTSETLFFDGDDYFNAVIKEIDSAHSSIEVETYIYNDDPVGRRVADALVRASHRGLNVRLIVDGIGASGWYEKNAPLLESHGVQVRVYHPILLTSLLSRLAIDIGLRHTRHPRGRALISRLNRRDHRKLFLIDSRIAYIGSLNITAEHCRSIVGELAWRDTAVRTENGPIASLTLAYDTVWSRCHDARARRRWRESLLLKNRTRGVKQKPSRLVRLNHTMRLRRRSYSELIHKISVAKSKVWITNAYFAPSRKLTRALKQAVENGADVRILVPRTSDVFFMPWVATAYYSLVLKARGRIYEYLPRFLHAKTAIVDGWSIVGSSNLNRRSLMHDFEVDVVVTKADTKAKLEAKFLEDITHSEEVVTARGGFTAFLGRVLSRVLRNWI